jgi:predicted enzyme related to lactoylglutathione lyase
MTDTATDPTIDTAGDTGTGAATLNAVVWWEIPVRDLAAAQAFYTAVFGWGYQPFGPDYAAVTNGGAMIGALSADPDAAASNGIRIYVGVADLEATLARGEAAGGRVETPRTLISEEMGWWAQLVDPEGTAVGICTDNAAV